MPNTSSQGITIDVKAQVTGWEQSLKQFQNALKNVDVGSSAGKKIGEMLNDLEGRIKGFSKNSEIKVFSDKQIDSTMAKIGGVDKMIMDIANRFSNLKVGDFSLLSGGAEIKQLGIDLANLQSQLKGLQGMTLGNLFKDFPQMIELFKQLGINLDTSNFKGIGDNIAKEFNKAQTEATNLQNALAAVDSSIADLQGRKAAKTEGPLGDLLDTGKYEAKMKELANLKMPEFKIDPNKMKQMGEQLLQNLDEALKTDKISDSLRAKGEAARAAIQEAFFPKDGIIDPTKLEANLKGIFDKFSSFDIGKLIRKGELFNNTTFAGQSGNTITGSAIYNWLGFKPEDVDKVKEEMTSKLNEFSSVISKQSSAQLGQMIKAGDINGFKDTLKTALDEALKNTRNQVASIESELKKLTEQREQIATRAAAASEKAGALQSGANTYNNVISDFQAKLSGLDKRISDIENQLGLAKGNLADKTKELTGGEGRKSAANLDAATTAAENYHKELNKVMSAEKMLGSIQTLITRWFSVYGVIRMVRQAFKSMASDIKQLDSTINKISIVTNFSMDQLWAQIPQYTALAQKYGVAISGVYEVSQLYYQQGLKTAEVNELTASTLQLAKISGLDYSTATNYMTNAVRSFKMEMEDANSVTDAYAALAASSASSVEELATAMSKTASSAQAVGMTMQETSAMMAVMIEATREAPENIGSAMKSIISRYGEMTTDPSKLVDSEGQEMSLNKVDKALKTVGITLQDEEGQFRSFTDVITELAGKWDSLSANTQRYIATVMAGNRQQSRFLALVSSGERLGQLTDIANNSEGTGAIQTEKTMDSIESKAQNAKNALQSVYNTQGIQNLIKGWYDFETGIAKVYANLAKISTLDFATALILQFMSIATAVTTIFGVIKSAVTASTARTAAEVTLTEEQFMNIRIAQYQQEGMEEEAAKAKAVAAWKQYETSKNAAIIERQATNTIRGQNAKGNLTGWKWGTGTKGTIARTATMLGGAALSIGGNILSMSAAQMGEDTEEERKAKATKTTAGSTMQGAGVGVSMGAMAGPYGAAIGGILGAVVGLINGINQAASIITETAEEKLNRLAKNAEKKTNKANESKTELNNLKQLKEQYDALYNNRNKSNESLKEYQELCNQIADTYPELISGYDAEGNAILNMTNGYTKLLKIKQDIYKQDLLDSKIAEIQKANDINQQLKDLGIDPADPGTTNTWGILFHASEKLAQRQLGGGYDVLSAYADEKYISPEMLLGLMVAESMGSTINGLVGWSGAIGNAIGTDAEAEKFTKILASAFDLDVKTGAKFIQRNGTEQATVRDYDIARQLGQTLYNDYIYGKTDEKAATLINQALHDAGETKYEITEAEVSQLRAAYSAKQSMDSLDRKINQVIDLALSDASAYIDTDKYSEFEQNYYVNSLRQLAKERIKNGENAGKVAEDLANGLGETGEYGIETVLNGYKNLNKKQQQQFETIWTNLEKYSDDQFDAMIEMLGLDENNSLVKQLRTARKESVIELEASYIDYWENIEKEYKKGENGLSESIMFGVDGWFDIMRASFLKYNTLTLQSMMGDFDSILNNDNITTKEKTQMMDIVNVIYGLLTFDENYNDDQISEIGEILATGDLFSLNGILDIIKQLQDAGYNISLDDQEGLGLYLRSLYNTIPTNLEAEALTLQSALADNFSKVSSALKSAKEGMELKDAISLASKLEIDFNSENFQFTDGKFFFNNYEAIMDKYIEETENGIIEINERIESAIEIWNDNHFDSKINELADPANGLQLILNEWGKVEDSYKLKLLNGSEEMVDLYDSQWKYYDNYVQTDKDFSEWLLDTNQRWADLAKMEIKTPEDADYQLAELSRLTGLDSSLLTKIRGNIIEYVKEWYSDTSLADNYDSFDEYIISRLQTLEDANNTALEAFKYSVNTDYITNGNLEKFLTSTKDIFKDGTFFDEAGNILDTGKVLVEALKNWDWGTIKNLNLNDKQRNYLESYSKALYEQYGKIRKNTYDSAINSISSGAQAVKATSNNREFLQFLGAKTYTGKLISELTDEEYAVLEEVMVDFSEASQKQLENLKNNIINDKSLSRVERATLITNLQTQRNKKTLNGVISSISKSYDSFEYDVADSVANLFNSTVEQAIKDGWMAYDNFLGTYKISDISVIRDLINTSGYKFQAQKLLAELDEYEQELSIKNILSEVIKNYASLTPTVLATLGEKMGMTYENIIEQFKLSDNEDGTYKVSLSNLKSLIILAIGSNGEIPKALQEQLNNLFDSIISEITNIPNTISKGITKTSDMQKYVDMLNNSGLFGDQIFTMLGDNAIFEWSDALHAYTYSTEGLKAQLSYFYGNLSIMTEDQQTAAKSLIKDNIRQMASNIDIISYLSSERTELDWASVKEAYKKFREYVELVNNQIITSVGLKPTDDLSSIESELIKVPDISEDLLKGLIDDGSIQALSIMKAIYEAAGKTLSTQDMTTIYRAGVIKLTDTVANQLTVSVGDIVDEVTKNIMEESGYTFYGGLKDQGLYVVQTMGDIAQVYEKFLQKLKDSGTATLKEMNAAAANVLATDANWGRNEQIIIDTLSKATSVTYDELATLFTSLGWELSVETMDQLQKAGILEKRGGNKVAITDWKAFAQLANFTPGSPEYVSALSAYNDALIQMNQEVEDQINNEIGNLTSYTRGTKAINLTYLYEKVTSKLGDLITKDELAQADLVAKAAGKRAEQDTILSYSGEDRGSSLSIQKADKAYRAAYEKTYEQEINNRKQQSLNNLNEELAKFGGYLEDGLLHLVDNANIIGIINTITTHRVSASALLESQIVELQDAIQSLLNNYVDLIKKGISGTLTNAEFLDLQDLASQFGIQADLDFRPTAEGLELTTQSIIELYNGVKQVNVLAAETIFNELVSNLQGANSELTTMAGVLNQVNSIQAQIAASNERLKGLTGEAKTAEEAKLNVLKQELAVYEQMASYMQLSQPDSYKMFDSGDAFSGVQGFTNFIDQFGTLNKTFADAGKNGYLKWTDFESWARGMTEMAKATGEDITSCGVTFDKAGKKYADLMKNAEISFNESGETIVSLSSGIGVEMDMSAVMAQTGNNEDAIQLYAEQQVEMLDSIISVLEVMAAMEELKDVDIDGDQTLSLGEIFNVDFSGFSTNMIDAAQRIKDAADTDEEVKKSLEQFKIGNHNVYELMNEISQEHYETVISEEWFGSRDATAAVIDWLYKSGALEYDPKDPMKAIRTAEEMFKERNDLGDLVLEFQIGDTIYTVSQYGTTSINADKLKEEVEKFTKEGMDESEIQELRQDLLRAHQTSVSEALETGEEVTIAKVLAVNGLIDVKRGTYTINIAGQDPITWDGTKDNLEKSFTQASKAISLLSGYKEVFQDEKGVWQGLTYNEQEQTYSTEVRLNEKVVYTVSTNTKDNKLQFSYNGGEPVDSEEKIFEQMYDEWLEKDGSRAGRKELFGDFTHDKEFLTEYNLTQKYKATVTTEFSLNSIVVGANGSNKSLRSILTSLMSGTAQLEDLQALDKALGENVLPLPKDQEGLKDVNTQFEIATNILSLFNFETEGINTIEDLAEALNFTIEDKKLNLIATIDGDDSEYVRALLSDENKNGINKKINIQFGTNGEEFVTMPDGSTWAAQYDEARTKLEKLIKRDAQGNEIDTIDFTFKGTTEGIDPLTAIMALQKSGADVSINPVLDETSQTTLAKMLREGKAIATLIVEVDKNGETKEEYVQEEELADKKLKITYTASGDVKAIEAFEKMADGQYSETGIKLFDFGEDGIDTLSMIALISSLGEQSVTVAAHVKPEDSSILSALADGTFDKTHTISFEVKGENPEGQEFTKVTRQYTSDEGVTYRLVVDKESGKILESWKGILEKSDNPEGDIDVSTGFHFDYTAEGGISPELYAAFVEQTGAIPITIKYSDDPNDLAITGIMNDETKSTITVHYQDANLLSIMKFNTKGKSEPNTIYCKYDESTGKLTIAKYDGKTTDIVTTYTPVPSNLAKLINVITGETSTKEIDLNNLGLDPDTIRMAWELMNNGKKLGTGGAGESGDNEQTGTGLRGRATNTSSMQVAVDEDGNVFFKKPTNPVQKNSGRMIIEEEKKEEDGNAEDKGNPPDAMSPSDLNRIGIVGAYTRFEQLSQDQQIEMSENDYTWDPTTGYYYWREGTQLKSSRTLPTQFDTGIKLAEDETKKPDEEPISSKPEEELIEPKKEDSEKVEEEPEISTSDLEKSEEETLQLIPIKNADGKIVGQTANPYYAEKQNYASKIANMSADDFYFEGGPTDDQSFMDLITNPKAWAIYQDEVIQKTLQLVGEEKVYGELNSGTQTILDNLYTVNPQLIATYFGEGLYQQIKESRSDDTHTKSLQKAIEEKRQGRAEKEYQSLSQDYIHMANQLYELNPASLGWVPNDFIDGTHLLYGDFEAPDINVPQFLTDAVKAKFPDSDQELLSKIAKGIYANIFHAALSKYAKSGQTQFDEKWLSDELNSWSQFLDIGVVKAAMAGKTYTNPAIPAEPNYATPQPEASLKPIEDIQAFYALVDDLYYKYLNISNGSKSFVIDKTIEQLEKRGYYYTDGEWKQVSNGQNNTEEITVEIKNGSDLGYTEDYIVSNQKIDENTYASIAAALTSIMSKKDGEYQFEKQSNFTPTDEQEVQIRATTAAIQDFINGSIGVEQFFATLTSIDDTLDYKILSAALQAVYSDATEGATKIGLFAQALTNIPTQKSFTYTVTFKVKTENEDKAEVVGSKEFSDNISNAKGNFAFSRGKGTLMGELGPEMVVSGGRYFIVGQNGAEFVNLDKDAIVFNHLQTKRLLNNGHGGHGKPITNEREATSFAKGNVSGPALASASSALSTLKALRDMWKNIAEKGLSEFAQQAGGGGGGGDGKNDAFIADLDRWYNLMREIDKLEKDITYQETLRSKLESDRVIDGKAYYESQKQSIKLLEDEIAKKHELVILQKQYYDARRKDLEASQFGEFITYDEHGHLQHTDAYYEKLADLMAQNGDSSAKYTAEEQYNMLVSWGFEDQMRYDTSGKEVDLKGGEGYAAAVQAFWDKLQKWQDDIDELYDGFTEYQNDVLDLESKFNEELQKIIDNQVSLENRIEKAIEDARQREIDEAKSQKDAIQKSSEQFIQGLTDSLDKERKMYEDTQSQNELNRMRRQLAILQRSGGSASQIRSLQQDIASREQDEYFNEQQNQIDAIQKASDAEIKKLEQQISIMEDTLKYEKEHGLLWNEVKDIMTWTPEEIESFLLENSKDLEGKSTLQIAEDLRTIKSEIEQWIGYRDDENNPIASEGAHNWNSYYTAAQSAYSLDEKNDATIINAAKAAYNETYERTGDENAAARAADEIFYKQFGDRPGAHAVAENTSIGSSSKNSGSSSKDSGGSGDNSNKGTLDISCYCNGKSIGGQKLTKPVGSYTPSYTEIINAVPDGYQYLSHTPKTVTISKNSDATIKVNCSIKLGSNKKITGYVVSGVMNGELITEKYADVPSSDAARKKFKQKYPFGNITNIYAYKKGGLANYTGLAMVHGTPQDPEAFLNAEETHMWRDKILSGNSGSLTSMLIDFQDMVSGMVSSDNYSEIGVSGSGVNIENAVVNMNATISNDYDARRAADTVMDEMIRIARKTTAQQARR